MNDEAREEISSRDLLNGGAILAGAVQHAGHVGLARGFKDCTYPSGG
jgi:hypothetical protein